MTVNVSGKVEAKVPFVAFYVRMLRIRMSGGGESQPLDNPSLPGK